MYRVMQNTEKCNDQEQYGIRIGSRRNEHLLTYRTSVTRTISQT